MPATYHLHTVSVFASHLSFSSLGLALVTSTSLMYACVSVSTHACRWVCLRRRPKVDIGCLPGLPSTSSLGIVFLSHLSVRLVGQKMKTLGAPLSLPPSASVTYVHNQAWFLFPQVGGKDLNSVPQVCLAGRWSRRPLHTSHGCPIRVP